MTSYTYEYWRAAQAGGKPPIHEGEPQPGYYRKRAHRNGPWLPVAIWEKREGSGLVASVNGRSVDPAEIWTWVADKPVSYEAFQTRFETGKWPDEAEVAHQAIGHNAPPADDHEALKAQAEEVIAGARAWLKKHKEISSQVEADTAANWAQRLANLAKEADRKRTEEKKPHLEAGRAVDTKWKPIIDGPKVLASQIKAALTRFMRAQKEAERRKAAEALKSGAKVVNANPAAGGQEGRKVALRRRKVAIIESYDKTLAHFAEHPDVKAVVQRLAQAAVRAGGAVPGVVVKEEEYAA